MKKAVLFTGLLGASFLMTAAKSRPMMSPIEDSTGAGIPHVGLTEDTDTPGANEYPVAWSFQNSAGNVTLPQLNASGELPVTLAGGTKKNANGLGTPASLDTDTDIATLTLTVSLMYNVDFFTSSSFWDASCRLEHNDDGTPTVLAQWYTGGRTDNYSANTGGSIEFTAGASGTQELEIICQQHQGPVSDIVGTFAVREF